MSDLALAIPDNNDELYDFMEHNANAMMAIVKRHKKIEEKCDAAIEAVKNNENRVEHVENSVAVIGKGLGTLETKVDIIKDNQYLEPYEATRINDAAKQRAYEVLSIRFENGVMADECEHDYKLYFGKFVRLIHSDARKAGFEVGKVCYTPRKNYEALLEFIGKWYPLRGVAGQKAYYDRLTQIKNG